MSQNCVHLLTSLHPTSYDISTVKLQKRVRVHVVRTRTCTHFKSQPLYCKLTKHTLG